MIDRCYECRKRFERDENDVVVNGGDARVLGDGNGMAVFVCGHVCQRSYEEREGRELWLMADHFSAAVHHEFPLTESTKSFIAAASG